jgi:hypothetical protein
MLVVLLLSFLLYLQSVCDWFNMDMNPTGTGVIICAGENMCLQDGGQSDLQLNFQQFRGGSLHEDTIDGPGYQFA